MHSVNVIMNSKRFGFKSCEGF